MSPLSDARDAPKSIRCNAFTAGRRCDFKGDRDELLAHATETGHTLCRTCSRSLAPDEPVVCAKCVQGVRDDLRTITSAFWRLPVIVEQSAYYGIAIDALTLAGDGSVASPQTPDGYTHPVVSTPTAHIERPEIVGIAETITWWKRDEAGVPQQRTIATSRTHPAYVEERKTPDGREHVRDHWPTDPTPVIACLEANERDWRHEFGHGPVVTTATISGCAGYLLTWLALAARTHPAFDEFAGEIRQLAITVTHATGLADDPVVAPAKCFDCGGDLIKPYRAPVTAVERLRKGRPSEGLPDDWECSKCGGVYDTASYFLAVRAALEARRAVGGLAS